MFRAARACGLSLRGDTIPAQFYVIPLFFLWVRLGLVDTLIGVIIVYWAIIFPLHNPTLRSYLLSLPRELEDASRVDGAGEIPGSNFGSSCRWLGPGSSWSRLSPL